MDDLGRCLCQYCVFSWVLWHCQFGDRRGIWPIKVLCRHERMRSSSAFNLFSALTCHCWLKGKGCHIPLEHRRLAHCHWASSLQKCVNHGHRNDRPVRLSQWQTCGYLSICRSSPPVDWYQIILLGDRDTTVWTTCWELVRSSAITGSRTSYVLIASPMPNPLCHYACWLDDTSGIRLVNICCNYPRVLFCGSGKDGVNPEKTRVPCLNGFVFTADLFAHMFWHYAAQVM